MLIHIDYKFAALPAVFAPRRGGTVRGHFHLHLHLLLHQQVVLLLLMVLLVVLVLVVVLLHHPFSSSSSASSYALFPFTVPRQDRKIICHTVVRRGYESE